MSIETLVDIGIKDRKEEGQFILPDDYCLERFGYLAAKVAFSGSKDAKNIFADMCATLKVGRDSKEDGHDIEGAHRHLDTFGEQINQAIRREGSYRRDPRNDYFKDIIQVFCAAKKAFGGHSYGHTNRVRTGAMLIAQEMGMGSLDKMCVEFMAETHDPGKFGNGSDVIESTERYDQKAFAEIKRHTRNGHLIFRGFKQLIREREGGDMQSYLGLAELMDRASSDHHLHYSHDEMTPYEREERRSYGVDPSDRREIDSMQLEPISGLSQMQKVIQRLSKKGVEIIKLADAYDAMISDRSYKSAQTHEFAIEEFKEDMVSRLHQWDPEIVPYAITAFGKMNEQSNGYPRERLDMISDARRKEFLGTDTYG